MNQLVNGVIVVLTAIIGVAILAVILSKQSNTTAVISQAGNTFSSILTTALSPVAGSSLGLNSAQNWGMSNNGAW